MKIIVDTREQLPLFKASAFSKCKVICKKLEVGDYSTENLREFFSIERKSPNDLYSTLIHNHVRFRNMLLFAAALEIKIVMYVECTRKKFINLDWYGGGDRNIASTTLEKIVNTVSERYKVEIVWCKDRRECKSKVYERLKREERNLAACSSKESSRAISISKDGNKRDATKNRKPGRTSGIL